MSIITAASPRDTAKALFDILNERARQIHAEGWTPEHDDEHDKGEMAMAAAAYAWIAADTDDARAAPLGSRLSGHAPALWPWDRKWWKPKSPRYDLVRAGALILAEIERLDRAEKREAEAAETAGDIIVAEWAADYHAVALMDAPHCPNCAAPHLLTVRDECFGTRNCSTCGVVWRVPPAAPTHADLDRMRDAAEQSLAGHDAAKGRS
ncbi:hypothetical protein [Parvibaculum sp.]|uniref:hypothetical protein n=1 Tax=Parvibaculum sp. TaxID=2024848 RepID=UPI002608BC47|nr:hypothetical protein [Parvibaculum sp.]MCW5727212.1 hypothetical protein [Parvibaculum sp.]